MGRTGTETHPISVIVLTRVCLSFDNCTRRMSVTQTRLHLL
jgi:hypothetical protein